MSLVKAANKKGIEAYLVGYEDSRIAKQACDQQVPFVGIGKRGSFLGSARAVFALISFVLKTKPSVVAVHYSDAFLFFALWKRLFNPSWQLIRFRTDPRALPNPMFSSWFYRQADLVVVPNRTIYNDLQMLYKIDSSKLLLLYGGVDRAQFFEDLQAKKSFREELGIEKDEIVIGSVGRLDAVKGHDILLDGYKILTDQSPNRYRLIICMSNDVEISMIREIINQRAPELLDKIMVFGKQQNIADFMRVFDVGVISSLGSEAICRVGMEMMACGVPIVSTDAGVLPEIVKESNRYEMHSPVELAKTLQNFQPDITIFDQRDFYDAFEKAILSRKGKNV